MSFFYWLCNTVCVLLGTCGLLMQPLKIWQYLVLAIYMTGAGMLGEYISFHSNFLMITLLLFFLICMVQKNKAANLALACVGYMLGIFFNNIFLVIVAKAANVTPEFIAEKYWLLFSISYLVLFALLIVALRYILYKKLSLVKRLELDSPVWIALAGNCLLFLAVFLITIMLGRSVGYDPAALKLNCIIFACCLLISSGLMIQNTKNILEEEKHKEKARKQKDMENYINGLEYMLDDMSRFRHNYKNLLLTMSGYIKEDRMEELKDFFKEKFQNPLVKEEAKTQVWTALRHIYPIEMKGFFYEKVVAAMAEGIEISIDVPKELHIEYHSIEDVIQILGIFLDNAMEAAKECTTKKVWISVRNTEGRMIFRIENTCLKVPDLVQMFEKHYSTKGEHHGNGLYWAQELIGKHSDMYHEIQIENGNVIQKLEIEYI